MIDRDHLDRWLQALNIGRDEPFTCQVFAEAPGSTVRPEHRHGTVGALLPWLEAANARGAGVFACIQRTDGQGRKAVNVTSARALFVDLDGAPLPARWHLWPSCIVASSPGRWHAYWTLTPGQPIAAVSEALRRLAAHYSGDPACHDLPRVLRLPGTIHRKGAPWLVTAECEMRHAYPLADVLDGIAELPRQEPPKPSIDVSARQLAARIGYGLVDKLDPATLDIVKLCQDAGLSLGAWRDGGLTIACPWSAEHSSDTGKTSTVVWPAGVKSNLPGYKCFHAHCSHRTLADLMRLFVDELENYATTAKAPGRGVKAAAATLDRLRY
jgi:hypothetical protein